MKEVEDSKPSHPSSESSWGETTSTYKIAMNTITPMSGYSVAPEFRRPASPEEAAVISEGFVW